MLTGAIIRLGGLDMARAADRNTEAIKVNYSGGFGAGLPDLADVIDSLGEPILILDWRGHIQYLNKAAVSLFSFGDKEELTKAGDAFLQLNPLLAEYFNKARQKNSPLQFEVELRDRWYEVHYNPNSSWLSVHLHDITKTKQLEHQLQQWIERFETSIDNMLDSFVILSAIRDESNQIKDFVIEFPNRFACSILRKTPQEIIGKTLFEVYPGHRGSKLFYDYVRVVETGQQLKLESYYYEQPNFSGYFDVQAIKTGDGLAVSWRDVTQRHLTEEALRLSEERFYKAFQLNPATMSISRVKDGSYINVNQRWLETTGYSPDEVIGNNATKLGLWADGDFCRVFSQAFRTSRSLRGLEVKVRTKSGKILYGHLSSEVIVMNGELCWLTVFQDLTEKRMLEEHLARLDRLNLIGETAASIGHEIRNPLTSVRGFLQLMAESEEGAVFKDYFDIIIEELDRTTFILSEFLMLAKDKAVNLNPHNLNSIVQAIYTLLQADANRNEKTIKLDLEPIPILNLDQKEIRQLVCNLARNGLEAMEAGGTLDISTRYVDGYVILAVKDTGKGIAPEIQEKLGTPFVSNKDGGTGLGLAVCYSIAARHHAQLSYETGPEGTTFFVKFKPPELAYLPPTF